MDNSFSNRLIDKLAKYARFILLPLKRTYIRHKRRSDRRAYNSWAAQNEDQCFVEGELTQAPKLSIVVPAYNTDKDHYDEMVYSVINQHYENWELVIVNASDDLESKDHIKSSTDIDARIIIVDVEKNRGISSNTNAGIEAASGEYIVFLDHDDLLHPCALHCAAEGINNGAELVYTDEDKITEDGIRYFGPHCKPDWSPKLLENLNYINHLTVIKSSLVNKIGGLRKECDGAQDYDLLWRIIDTHKPKVVHISHILYHWRAAMTSTANQISTKTYIFEAGKKTLETHFAARNIHANIHVLENRPGFYKPSYKEAPYTVVIGETSPDRQPAAAAWIHQLRDYIDKDAAVIVGDWFKKYSTNEEFAKTNAVVIPQGGHYLTTAIDKVQTGSFILFNEAAIPRNKKSLSELANFASAENIVAQPVIISDNNTILDAGLVDSNYGLQPLFRGIKLAENTFFGDTDWVRDINSVDNRVIAASKSHVKVKNNLLTFKNEAKFVLWPHTTLEYISFLNNNMKKTPMFNSQLNQSMFEIKMKSSTWDGSEGRADD